VDLRGGISPTAPDKSDTAYRPAVDCDALPRTIPLTNDAIHSTIEIISTQPLHRAPSSETVGAVAMSVPTAVVPLSPKRKKVKWADQMPNGRLWTVTYIEDTCFEAGLRKGNDAPVGSAGRERWNKNTVIDDDDDEDEEEGTDSDFSCFKNDQQEPLPPRPSESS
jgi:hypothetical protein